MKCDANSSPRAHIPFDPYAGNLLTSKLGHILERKEVFRSLLHAPPLPPDPEILQGIPKEVRLHMLMDIQDLHLPNPDSYRRFTTVDLLIRQGYRSRDPTNPRTWGRISGEAQGSTANRVPGGAALIVGPSGVGKSVAILKTLSLYPQIITHEHFPHLVGPHYQVVWLSVNVPSSGKLGDLAVSLMTEWDDLTSTTVAGGHRRFSQTLSRLRNRGPDLMNEWQQVAQSHFLGCLHLDEVQNFFKLPTLAQRRKAMKGDSLELSIVDDMALKSILTFVNMSGIPIIMSGTPDGVAALAKRFSNIQRLVRSGFHRMDPYSGPEDPDFITFMAHISRYQYVIKRLPADSALREVFYAKSAGVNRLMIALWIAGHRCAYERAADDLRISDFEKASRTYLAPAMDAVQALLSKNPSLMCRYEDMMPRGDQIWAFMPERS